MVKASFVWKSTVQVWPDTLQRGEFRRVLFIEPYGTAKIVSIVTTGYAAENHLTTINELRVPSSNFKLTTLHEKFSDAIEDPPPWFDRNAP